MVGVSSDGAAKGRGERARIGARVRRLGLLLLLGSCADSPAPPSAPRAERPERILLVSMDTVRADALDEPSPERQPHLLALAREGVRFSRFYAASTYTIPSHMSMFTGLDPEEHGITDGTRELTEDVPTLASHLRAAGYRTQAFHEGGYVGARYGFDRGFDAYEELERVSLVEEELERVVTWIRDHADEPWFLFLHTFAAHNPYGGYERYRATVPARGLVPVAELLEQDAAALRGEELEEEMHTQLLVYNQLCEARGARAESARKTLGPEFTLTPHFRQDLKAIRVNYGARISRIDAALGRLRAELEELGQWEDTLLVVTSDHGEAFFEHGVSWHGYIPFDEVLRVPLFVSYPRWIGAQGGRVIDQLTWHLDLYPTLLSLAGIDAGGVAAGVDLSDLLRGDTTDLADRALYPLVQEVPTRRPRAPRRVGLRGTHKFVESAGDLELLFDLSVDPNETRNLAQGEPAACEAWRAELETYRSGLQSRYRPREEPLEALDDEALDALRAMGYAE